MIDFRQKNRAVVLALVVLLGGLLLGWSVSHRFCNGRLCAVNLAGNGLSIPLSKLPGPPREPSWKFELDPASTERAASALRATFE